MIEALLNIVGPIDKYQLALTILGKQIKPVALDDMDKADQTRLGQTLDLLKNNNINVEAVHSLTRKVKSASISYKRATYFDFIFPLAVPIACGVFTIMLYFINPCLNFEFINKVMGSVMILAALLSMVRRSVSLDKSYRFDQIALYLDDYAKTLESMKGSMWHMKKPYTRGNFKA
jgi:hypothetical protein